MVKILLVLGDQKGINPRITRNDILVPRSLGSKRFLIDATVIENPTQDEFQRSFRSKSFDILIIVGHTNTNDDGRDGTITINNGKDTNGNSVPSNISMNQYQGIFRDDRVRKRLKLVILAGCCSDGAARNLTMEKGVPKVIAFRRPIAPSVVRVFFEELFGFWIKDSLNLQSAMGRTREHLQRQDPDSPGASATPILLTSVDAEQDLPLIFSEIAQSSLRGKLLDPLLSIPLISTLFEPNCLRYLGYLLLIVAGIVMALWLSISSQHHSKIACNISDIDKIDYISCGEKDLFSHNNNSSKNPVFTKEIKNFEQIWQDNMSHPQLQIATSNKEALRKFKKGKNIKTIAVMLPLSRDIIDRDPDLPIGMLSAVAQYQHYWNKQDHSWKLQVMMVNDYNIERDGTTDKDKADKAVDFITKNKNILAVIGHYNSGTTKNYIKKYDTEKLTLISGTNTAPDINCVETINNKCTKTSEYYFRNATTTDVQAKELTDYLKGNIKNVYIIAGTGTYAQAYVKSLTNTKNITFTGYKKIQEIENKDTEKVANQIAESKPQALILIPNPFVENNTQGLINLIASINRKLPQCLIIGTETLARNSFWQFLGNEPNHIKDLNLLLSIPFNSANINMGSLDLSFMRKNKITHRVILTYDSMKVLIDAIDTAVQAVESEQNKTESIRSNLPKYIREITNSNYTGITGVIKFDGVGNRQQLSSTIAKIEFDKEKKDFKLTPV